MAIPQEVCKATRAVLLSSKKGVLLKNFTKDYKSLFGSDFPWKSLGYQSPLAMLQEMTTCAQLIYDTVEEDHRAFGVAEGHSYVSIPLLKAQWSQKKEELLLKGKETGRVPHKSPRVQPHRKKSKRKTPKRDSVKTNVGQDASGIQPVTVCVRYKPEPDFQWEREHWKQDQLKKLFSSVGTITRVFVTSKGHFAFVDFSTLGEAQQAFTNFNYSHYKGKTLVIRWGTPKVSKPSQGQTGSFKGTSMNPSHAKCAVGLLPGLKDTAQTPHSQGYPPPSQYCHDNPDSLVGTQTHLGKSPMAKLKACLDQLSLSALDTPTESPIKLRERPAPATFSDMFLPRPTESDEELEDPYFEDQCNGTVSSDTSSLLEDETVITREGVSTVLQQCCVSEVVSPDLFYVQTSPTVVRDLENLSSSIAKNELHPLIGAVPREGDIYCVFAQGRWIRVVVVAFHDVLDQICVMDVDTGRNLTVPLCDVRHLPPPHSLASVPPLAIPCCLHGVCSSHLQGWWPLDCQLLWKLTNNCEVFSLFHDGPIRPPACVAVELFLDNCGRESVAERLVTEGSCVALLSEGEPSFAPQKGDYPVVISMEEKREFSQGTQKGEWEGSFPLMSLEEEEATDSYTTSLPTSEGISKRGSDLKPMHADVLSDRPLSPSSVGQGGSVEGKAKRGVFGRFVSALETTQQSTLDPPTLFT